jgi:hypothetical protein
MTGVLVALVLPAVGLATSAAVPATSIRMADVHGDDENDRYVGTGGLILPGTVDATTRQTVSGCTGCGWRLSTPCLRTPIASTLGHAFDGESACMSVVRGCPSGRQLLRVWFLEPGRAWREMGLVCLGDSAPVTVRQAEQAVADRFAQGMPRLEPTFQPVRGIVAQLPVVFATGQAGGQHSHVFRLLGSEVRLDATPSWRWDFGDEASVSTADPGGTYPHMAVAHPYRRSGEFVVTVTTRWSATFVVDGLGPFPVTEPVIQRASLDLSVGEGRALLVP